MKRSGTALVLARWSARHPWRAIAGWALFVLACVALGSAVGTRQLTAAETGSGESARADVAIEAAGYPTDLTESVLIQSRSGQLSPRQGQAVARELTTALDGLDVVDRVGDPMPSEDGTSLLLPVVLNDGGNTGYDAVAFAAQNVQPMMNTTGEVQSRHPDLRVEQAGDASIEVVLGDRLASDFRLAEYLSVPVTLGILLIAFGALFAAGVPVLLALSAVASAIGLSALVSQILPVTEELASVVLLIGMAVGVDYSLFYVRRAREERQRGASPTDAVELAAATSGRAVLVSGVAVMVAMSGMFISGNAVFVSFAIGTMLVVAVAMLGSLTVLPAVLAKFGDRIERPRVPLVHRLRRPDGEQRVWPALMRIVTARPLVALTIGVIAMLALAAPALTMELRNSGSDSLPRSIPLVATYDRIVTAYPQEGITHTVAVWSDERLDRAAVEAAVTDLGEATSASPLFVGDPTQASYSPDGTVATVDLAVPFDESDPRSQESLDILRSELIPQTLGNLENVSIGVTGTVAENLDFVDQMGSRLPYVIGFVLALSFIILLLAFRSPVIAFTAIVLNTISVAAAYGLLVIVFQHTWAEGILGFQSNGAVISWLPLFLFVVLFGLSMDYHVFVVSRIREAAMRGLPIREAVAEGVSSSASVVTSAAAVMIGVFSIFATLSLLEFKQLGVGLAVAILLDATVVRIVLLPAAMALLGRWNWWTPQSLGRLPVLETNQVPSPVVREPEAVLA
jgi:RND superfamily putative drug exporter